MVQSYSPGTLHATKVRFLTIINNFNYPDTPDKPFTFWNNLQIVLQALDFKYWKVKKYFQINWVIFFVSLKISDLILKTYFTLILKGWSLIVPLKLNNTCEICCCFPTRSEKLNKMKRRLFLKIIHVWSDILKFHFLVEMPFHSV